MTNEELAQRIKAGEKDLLGQLWEQTERLLKYMIDRELRVSDKEERAEAAGVTREDLYQEGYFALLQAVEAYDPETGFTFSAFLKYPIKSAVNRALKIRNGKAIPDPLFTAINLDAPIRSQKGEPDGDRTYYNNHPDERDLIKEATERLFREALHEDLEKGLAELPDREERVLRAKYYEGRPLEEIGSREGLSMERARQIEQDALEQLRARKDLQAYRDEIITRYAYKGGFQRWKNTGESSVEAAALKLAELDERAEKLDRWAALRSLK